jgi:hypothetical protein
LGEEDVLLHRLPHAVARLRRLLELPQEYLVLFDDLDALVDEVQVEVHLLQSRNQAQLPARYSCAVRSASRCTTSA